MLSQSENRLYIPVINTCNHLTVLQKEKKAYKKLLVNAVFIYIEGKEFQWALSSVIIYNFVM